MAKIHGKNGKIYFGTADISGDSNKMTIDLGVDAVDVSTFGDSYKTYVEGAPTWTASVAGFWNKEGMEKEIYNAIGEGTSIVRLFPGGTAVGAGAFVEGAKGNMGYEGHGIITSKHVESPIDGAVTYSAEIQGDSKMRRTSVLWAEYYGAESGERYAPLSINMGSAGSIFACYSAGSFERGDGGNVVIQIMSSTASAMTGIVRFSNDATITSNTALIVLDAHPGTDEIWYKTKLQFTNATADIVVTCVPYD